MTRRLFISRNNQARLSTVSRTMTEDISLVDFCERRRQAAGLTINALEEMSRVPHPGYASTLNGKYDGLKAMVKVLDTLGYEFVLRKKDGQ